MAKGDSRLWRKLGATQPLFNFNYGSNTLDDNVIRSATIHRGGEGVTPSTLELSIAAFGSVSTGHYCNLELSTYGQDLVNNLIGSTGTWRGRRFTGRIGQQSVDDRGGTKQYTTYMAASQSAQLPSIKKTYSFAKGESVRVVIQNIMNPPSLPAYSVVGSDAIQFYGHVWEPVENKTYGDLIGKFTTDLGIFACETRTGAINLKTHEYRNRRAVESLSTVLPLSRAQGLAPATWEQANETRPRNFLLKYWDASRQLTQQLYGDTADTLAEVIDLDMSYVQFRYMPQPEQEAKARRAREWLTGYSLPTVKVDLIQLLSSSNIYDRMQAGRLIGLEVGDPLYFSGDWHSNLDGINYAQEITETITPDTWEMEFTLLPSQEVTGYISPTIPARTWDQATYPWDTETRTWNGA